jgi:hypothetical protein
MCITVQTVQTDHIEGRRVVENSPILRSQEEPALEVEVGATAVNVPEPGLRAPSRYSAGIEYQSTRAPQHEGHQCFAGNRNTYAANTSLELFWTPSDPLPRL